MFPELAQEGHIVCCLQTAIPEAIERLECEFPKVRGIPMTTFDDRVRAFSPDAGIFEDGGDRAFAEEVMIQIGQQLTPQQPLAFGDLAALVSIHNTIANNTLPVFWSSERANGREWNPPLEPRILSLIVHVDAEASRLRNFGKEVSRVLLARLRYKNLIESGPRSQWPEPPTPS